MTALEQIEAQYRSRLAADEPFVSPDARQDWVQALPLLMVAAEIRALRGAGRKPLAAGHGQNDYERLDPQALMAAVGLGPGDRLLVLQPYGWYVDGHKIPNQPEQFSIDEVCRDMGWAVICRYGDYVAIVKEWR